MRQLGGWLLLALLLPPLGYQHVLAAGVTPPAGLIAWWPGDGTPLNLAGPPAVMQGGAGFAAGRVGQAFHLDGNGQYASTELDVQPSALPSTTWEAWIFPTKVKASARQNILSIDNGGYGRAVLIEAGTTNFGVFTGSGVWQPTSVATNEWQHIAVSFTPTNIIFYKNGAPFVYGKVPNPQSSSQKLSIGRNPGYGQYFFGDIDEVTIYSRALAESEIQAIYQAGSAGKFKTGNGSADLDLSIHTTPDPANLDQNLTNVFLAANLGPDPAPAIFLSVTLPTNAAFVSASTSAGTWYKAGNKVQCQLGDLPPGQSAAVTVVLTPSGLGLVNHGAVVSSLASDPDLSNNAAATSTRIYNHNTPTDGDWEAFTMVLTNTPEAELMVRTGDIDNLGFGWRTGFNPFSGNSTTAHAYPWKVDTNDPAGTDRIMVVTSYEGHPPAGRDGYTLSTTRPGNNVQSIELTYDLQGRTVQSAALQIFIDDFQAPAWKAAYQVTLNGVRAPFLETLINSLSQTGPIGKLISVAIPPDYLPGVRSGRLVLQFDDPTTGAGDGYAIDFVKLMINIKAFMQVGTVQGWVVDAANQLPIEGAQVSAGGITTALTDRNGHYALTNVAAGLVVVEASHLDCDRQIKSTDLITWQTNQVDFALVVQPRLRIEKAADRAVISWPGTLTGYLLQATPSLNPPQPWALEGSTPARVNGRSTVTQPLNQSGQYYRLIKP